MTALTCLLIVRLVRDNVLYITQSVAQSRRRFQWRFPKLKVRIEMRSTKVLHAILDFFWTFFVLKILSQSDGLFERHLISLLKDYTLIASSFCGWGNTENKMIVSCHPKESTQNEIQKRRRREIQKKRIQNRPKGEEGRRFKKEDPNEIQKSRRRGGFKRRIPKRYPMLSKNTQKKSRDQI